MMKNWRVENRMRFTDGNVCFVVIQRKKGTADIWIVQVCIPGVMLGKSGCPRTIEMSEQKILEIAAAQTADSALRTINTVGTRPQERMRATKTQERITALKTARDRVFSRFNHQPDFAQPTI